MAIAFHIHNRQLLRDVLAALLVEICKGFPMESGIHNYKLHFNLYFSLFTRSTLRIWGTT